MPETNESYDELIKRGRETLLSAIVGDKTGFAGAIRSIFSDAVSWGRCEAATGRKTFHATVKETDFHKLRDDIVEDAINDLFDGTKLKTIIDRTCLAGAALGFQNHRKLTTDEGLEAIIERVTAAATAREPEAQFPLLTSEEANEIIKPLIDMPAEKAINYARMIFTKFRINAEEVPAFKTFLDKYAAMVMPV